MIKTPAAFLFPAFLLSNPPPQDPLWRVQPSGVSVELRGLSAAGPEIAWATGAKGTVLRTVDGRTWERRSVPGAEELDFRDVHAADAQRAWILAAGPGAAGRIYATRDGGSTWTLQFTNPEAAGFLDALAFWDAKHGIAMGDAVRGRIQVLLTADGGLTWLPVPEQSLPPALENEGAFAASGTCLTVQGSKRAWFATGGAKVSRVFRTEDGGFTWGVSEVPVPAGEATKGLFTVAFADGRHGVALGGDYKLPNLDTANGAFSQDGGRTWKHAKVQPRGLLSGTSTVPGQRDTLIAVGLAGTGISRNGGQTWKAVDTTPLNAVAFATTRAGWAVGPKGLIARYAGPLLGK